MNPSARQVVDLVLEVGLRQDLEALAELMAPDATLEWPFRPAGVPDRLNGRAEIRAFLGGAGRAPIKFEEYRDIVVHETADPEVVIVEYEVFGRVTTTGGPFHQTVIAVLRVRDGLVVSYRDYINPLALAGVLAAPES